MMVSGLKGRGRRGRGESVLGRRPSWSRAGWRTALIGLIVAALLTAAGCGGLLSRGAGTGLPQRAEGEYGGIWRDALPRDPLTLDPARAVTLMEGRILALMYNGLVRLTADGRVEPDLAESWEIEDEGHTYIFHLRPDVVFHDESPLTADDVVLSFNRLAHPDTDSPRAWVLSAVVGSAVLGEGLADHLAGVEALDEMTVRITLEKPQPQFLQLLTIPAASIIKVSRHALPGTGTGAPAGTGPFRLVQWERGRSLQFEAFEHYYAGRAYLDGVHFTIQSDGLALAEAFQQGELHVIQGSLRDINELTSIPGWSGSVQKVNLPAVYYFALNNQVQPLSDPLVRRAIYLAIDREALLEQVLPGDHVIAHGSIPPGLIGYDGGRRLPEADPLQARQLLSQAGYADGFTLKVIQTPSILTQEINRGIQEMLERVGIEVELVTVDSARFFTETGALGSGQAFTVSWFADYAEAENFLYPLFHSSQWGEGGNRSRFSSPEVDVMLEELRTGASGQDRGRLYAQVEEMVFQKMPWVPLYFPVQHEAVHPAVRNYTASAFYHTENLWAVWLEGGEAAGAGSSTGTGIGTGFPGADESGIPGGADFPGSELPGEVWGPGDGIPDDFWSPVDGEGDGDGDVWGPGEGDNLDDIWGPGVGDDPDDVLGPGDGGSLDDVWGSEGGREGDDVSRP